MKVLKLVRNLSDTAELQSDLDRYYRTVIIINYGHIITKVNSIRDLGVLHDGKLLFDSHIESIVNKASKELGFIIRNCSVFRSLKSIKVLYCSFVHSHLEYASQVWNPQYEIYKSRIEYVQRKFMRY
ncbi:hypothetical protein PYW08_015058 [Mythimna loreyi]|uniref:Uncharacterized protein n=1 Tax=Mythimna loreyi TaxID=667449 RepID=A0ACC2R3L9_9NEOP|nr:hypothetical protein PYW08_015058 [Mythimna loreyi]